MSAWKTMETCPHDEPVLLVFPWLGKQHRFVGFFDSDRNSWREGDTPNGAHFPDHMQGHFTHWAELIAPPLPGESNARFIAGPEKVRK